MHCPQVEEQVTAVAATDDFADDEVEAIMAGEAPYHGMQGTMSWQAWHCVNASKAPFTVGPGPM